MRRRDADACLTPVAAGVGGSRTQNGGKFWQAEPDVPSASPRSARTHVCVCKCVCEQGDVQWQSRWLSQSNVRSHETTHTQYAQSLTYYPQPPVSPEKPHVSINHVSKQCTFNHKYIHGPSDPLRCSPCYQSVNWSLWSLPSWRLLSHITKAQLSLLKPLLSDSYHIWSRPMDKMGLEHYLTLADNGMWYVYVISYVISIWHQEMKSSWWLSGIHTHTRSSSVSQW